MSMGYGANYADVVEDKTVKKIVGAKLFDSFMKKYEELDRAQDDRYLSEDELVDTLNFCAVEEPDKVYKDDSPALADLRKTWKAVYGKFLTATGLNLYLEYHSSEDCGDRYDEVDGLYFVLASDELYQPTQAFLDLQKKFGKKVVQRKFYVSFG